MAERGTPGRTDRLLLIEVGLVGLFVVLLFALYLVPVVTSATYQPGAWRWITLAIPFFGALYLETRRRRTRQRAAVRDVIEGEAVMDEQEQREKIVDATENTSDRSTVVDGEGSEPVADEPPIR